MITNLLTFFNNDYLLSCGILLTDPFIIKVYLFIIFFYSIIGIIYINYYSSVFYIIFISTLPIILLFLSSFDLFFIAFMLEALSISLYFLIILSNKSINQKSIEVIFKLFFIGAVSTFLILMGSSIFYGFVGSTSFFFIKKFIYITFLDFYVKPFLFIMAIFLILFAFMLKLGIFPFNWWVADIYDGMPYIILLFYNTVIKVCIFFVFIKLTTYLFFGIFEVNLLLYLGCIGSLIYGCFASINQLNIKRFMAFSGINNIGWLLLGVCCENIEGLSATFLYLFTYTLMNFIFWFIFCRLEILGKPLLYFSDLNNLFKSDPFSASLLAFTLISMAGFPPFGGFFSKYCLLFAAVNSKLYSLVFLALIVSAISGFYYLKLIKSIFFDLPDFFNFYTFLTFGNSNFLMEVYLFVLSFLLIFFGFFVSCFYNYFVLLAYYCVSPFFN